MILLLGSNAYSPFRMDALKDAVAKADPSLAMARLDANWVYALETAEGGAAPEEMERAASLLNASLCGEREIGPVAGEGAFFVFPRKGTISPWSSKATDIFRNCSIASIRRVERGVIFRASQPMSGAALHALHDKMTEGVYDDISDLFEAGEPRPGRVYDVLGRGVAAIREANEEMGLAISEQEMQTPSTAATRSSARSSSSTGRSSRSRSSR